MATPDPGGSARPGELHATLALGFGLLIGWSGLFYLIGALFLVWETETSLGKAELSMGLTAAILMSALVAPVTGKIIDAGDGRFVLPGGVLLGASGLALLSQTTSTQGFMAARIVIGVAQGLCLYEATFTFLARALRQRGRRAITVAGLCGGSSTVLAYPLANLIADAHGWRVAVLCFAVLLACVAAPLMYLGAAYLEPASCNLKREARKRAARRALTSALRQPVFWTLMVAFACLGFTEGLILSHGIPALVEFGAALPVSILCMALVGPFQSVSRIGLLCIGMRGPCLPLVAVSVLAMGGGVALLVALPGQPNAALVVAILFGLGYGLTVVLKPVMVSDCLGYASIGGILGVLALPYLGALAAAPYAGSLLWSAGGYALALQVAVATALASLLALLLIAALLRLRR